MQLQHCSKFSTLKKVYSSLIPLKIPTAIDRGLNNFIPAAEAAAAAVVVSISAT